MDIAATGFGLPLLGPLQDLPQPRTDNPRGRADTARGPGEGVLDETRESRNERVVPGEVIYARPNDGRARSRAESVQSGFSFAESGTRRQSLQAAAQIYRDNEALLTAPGQTRQVSGIIDEYV
jgi:hypothetical protein